MEKVSKKDIQIIHALLARLGLVRDADHKRGLIETYSHGRETSTKELYVNEAGELKEDLQKMLSGNNSESRIKANDKRRLMLHYAHEMMWELPGGKVDMARVNGWCVNYGRYHKALMEHSLEELSYLLVQFEKVYRSFLKSI
jgi:hypothetical protein